MTKLEEVREVLRHNPDLGIRGFEDETPIVVDTEFVAQVEAARLWMTTAPGRSYPILNRTSYDCKHRAERWAGRYITNSAMIVAAALSGYDLLRTYCAVSLGHNCKFRRAKATT